MARSANPGASNSSNVQGISAGVASTYATLPTLRLDGEPLQNCDTAILDTDDIGTGTAQNPQYPKGLYKTNGTVWSNVLNYVDDAQEYHAVRADILTGVEPTIVEAIGVSEGNTATVFLQNKTEEYRKYINGAWALQHTKLPVVLDGNQLPFSRPNAITGAEPTATEIPNPVSGDSAKIFLSDGRVEVRAYDGTNWNLVGTTEPEQTDTGALATGNVDAQALLAKLGDGVGFHFHTILGPVNLTSTGTFNTVIDGDTLGGGASPLTIPKGTHGYMSRNADGSITVSYKTDVIQVGPDECYEEFIDAPLAGSEFTLDNTNGGPSNAGITFGTSQIFHAPDRQIFFDLNELPKGARIKSVSMYEERRGNNTASVFMRYDGVPTNLISPALHANGFSATPSTATFATSLLIDATTPLILVDPSQNHWDYAQGAGEAWIASITPGTATASGGANDGVTSPMTGFNATVTFELSQGGTYTVRKYSNGKVYATKDDGTIIDVTGGIPTTWNPCPVTPIVSADTDNLIIAGSDGGAYLGPECTDVTEQFTAGATQNPGGTNPSGITVTEITVNKTQDITIVHTGTSFTGGAGAGIGVSSIPYPTETANVMASADIFSSTGDRIDATTPSKAYTVNITPGTYYIGVWSGGNSSTATHALDITYCKPVVDNDLDYVKTQCYEEAGTTLAPLDNDPFADEINATQLATLPAGAHMRWTSPDARVLNTLEVNGFNGTVTISWTASTGVSGSQSVTFGTNPQGLNLGGIALSAGDTIDFTLDSISAGQMQLTTPATSIANGWTALQDYSAFANTSHWATRLLTSTPSIEHIINIYEDTNGDTVYKEVIGNDLTLVTQAVIDTYTSCPTTPIVSADAENEIVEGADGGAYYKAPKIDACAINEYIHNIKPFWLVLSKEGPSGHTITTNVNGTLSTYENLVNANDLGSGEIRLVAGNNENYNSHGTTVETITECDEYIEVIKGATSNFHTEWVSISSTKVINAQNAGQDIRISFLQTGYTLYDEEGNVASTGNTEAGTYRFTRTLRGFEVKKDGIIIYTSPEKCVDYNKESTNTVQGATGLYRVGDRHESLTAITNTGAGTSIVTGHDLTQATNMTLTVKYQDTNSAHSWTQVQIDVDSLMARYLAGESQDASDTLFDNDFVTADIVNPVTGEIAFTYIGRAFSYVWSELWAIAQQDVLHATKLRLVSDTALATATATQLEFDTVDYDTGSIADIANNQVVIAKDGLYELDASLFHMSSNRVAQLFIQVNGNNVARDISAIANGDQVVSYSPKASTKIQLSQGDIVTVVYYSQTASTTTGEFTQLTVTQIPTTTSVINEIPSTQVNNTSNTAETEYNIEGTWNGNQRYTQTAYWTGSPPSPLLLATTIDPTKVIKIEGIGVAGGGSARPLNTTANGTAGNVTRVNSAGTGFDITEYGGFDSSNGGHVTVHYYK